MSLNVEKCSVLSFGHVNTTPNADYKLNGSFLKQVGEAKYLGVILQFNLKNMTQTMNHLAKVLT